MRKIYWWIAGGVLLFLIYSLTVQKSLERVRVGQPAPSFELPDRSGVPITLASHRGEVVLVNFWATWCGLCVSEVPALNRLAERFSGRPFTIIGVSEDGEGGGGWEAIDAFSRQIPLEFTVLLDGDGHVADSYGAYAIPMSFIIDKNGSIARIIEGTISSSDRTLVNFFDSLATVH